MQNKGFVRVFALLLALVCIFYLSFSFVTSRYNRDAAAYANGDSAKESYYLDSLSNKTVWLGYTLKQCRENEITLGLDLKGGMNVILELNVADVIRSLSNNNKDANFNKALGNAYARQSTSQRGFIDLFVEEYRKIDPGARLSAIFSTFELKEKITPQSADEVVLAVLRTELQSAIDNSFNVLRTRIDRFGVVSPNIQRLETDGRILVELPGVKEPERVRKLLQGSANLEFWETYNLTELYQQLSEADAVLASMLEAETATAAENETAATETTAADDLLAAAKPLEDAAKLLEDSIKGEASEVDSLLKQLGDDDKDVTQTPEDVSKQHPLFSLLAINSYNGQLVPGPVVGIADRKDMIKIDSLLNVRQVKEILPNNVKFRWAVKSRDKENEQYFELYALKVTNRDGSPALSGDVVTDANADFSQDMMSHAEQVVSMSMNAEGAKAWARLTKDNIGNCVAIVLDNLVYSAPTVNDEITGGQSRISGQFSVEEAKDLANVLKSGKMAASVNIVHEDIVGPSLGQEAINAGVISFIVALILLMAYMCAIYGLIPGMIANGALIVNIFFTLGVLASFKAVLTLPGIAGMVLTLGMAVDANVLIYERAKEELRAGKQLARAISEGYSNAFSAIFDSNLTTMITGIVLFVFGTGPIKGFAWTLLIGLSASFLTSVFLTRLVYEWLIAKNKVKNLTFITNVSKGFLTNTGFDFLSWRKKGYIIPAIIVMAGAVSFATIGLNSGIDFTGGRNYVIQFDREVSTDDIRVSLDEQLDGFVSVITIGTGNQVRVSTNYKITDNDPTVDEEISGKLFDGLKEYLPENVTLNNFTENYIQSSQKVGPSMADDIKNSAIMAVIFAMICMALYILIRFRDVAFSVGVFVSVLATTLCIIAFYTLLWKVLPFSMEVDQTFIAAILTVIGYSLNDTVVVFDRIRETIRNYPKRDRHQVINDALNSTLARTFNTSISTFIVVLIIFLLGGATIRSFTFAIMLGVIVGTYSTLFVATPLAYEIQKRRIAKKSAAAETAVQQNKTKTKTKN
ncbi:MAG: protein translocase subunit SecDF [Tannerella sp.]|jgi:SecD/SecF fusion protein|nr:protein translocase subunit SecDF [Tannerella sp.]